MANDLDALMERIDQINAKSPYELSRGDISDIIAYHRQNRVRGATQKKPERVSLDISDIRAKLLNDAKVVPIGGPLKRRV